MDPAARSPTPPRAVRAAAWASLAAMLVVVAASAHIRARGGIDVGFARGAHRAAASTVAVLATLLLAFAWRPGPRVAALAAFVLMLALSAVGWVGGATPPPAAALFNQQGGLAMAALVAWIAGRAEAAAASPSPARALATAALLLAALQASAGGLLALLAPQPSALLILLHAAAGLAAASVVAANGARYALAAIAAPVFGACAAIGSFPAAPAAHALAAALLLCAGAHAHGRAAA